MMCRCSKCGVEKVRMRAERDPSEIRRHVYRDENGVRWNRLQCPECRITALRMRNRSRPKTRSGKPHEKKVYNATYIAPGTRLRVCRNCGLETPNYFHCSGCLSASNYTYAAELETCNGW